jgi:transposase InsO family protein
MLVWPSSTLLASGLRSELLARTRLPSALFRTFRAECLDHLIVTNERHLKAVLTEFIGYYNHDRPHRTLDLQMPVPRSALRAGEIVSRPILGGLHHAYARAA